MTNTEQKDELLPSAHHHAKPMLPACGCTDDEHCNGDCLVPKWIAERVLAARDAHIAGDYNEVWHQLYSIADPTFTSFEPWEALEEMVK